MKSSKNIRNDIEKLEEELLRNKYILMHSELEIFCKKNEINIFKALWWVLSKKQNK